METQYESGETNVQQKICHDWIKRDWLDVYLAAQPQRAVIHAATCTEHGSVETLEGEPPCFTCSSSIS